MDDIHWQPLPPARPRDTIREELRQALVDYLDAHGGKARAIKAVSYVAGKHYMDILYVTSAMWTLVDDGVLRYTRKAKLKRVKI